MPKELYVYNLPYDTDAEELSAFFAQHATVIESCIIRDKETKESRGYGFVKIEEEAPADLLRVIQVTNGLSIGGRELKVSEARGKPQRRPAR